MSLETKSVMRCAIYTRKSSEEGLEQSFNSLDAPSFTAIALVVNPCAIPCRTWASRALSRFTCGLRIVPVLLPSSMSVIESLNRGSRYRLRR